MSTEHIGDGVYVKAGPEIYGIVLMANDHRNPTDTIYLEPSVMKALVEFARRENVIDE